MIVGIQCVYISSVSLLFHIVGMLAVKVTVNRAQALKVQQGRGAIALHYFPRILAYQAYAIRFMRILQRDSSLV
jgi:hypothetical protein